MSKRSFDPLQIPPRWLNCPRKADSLIDKFIAFKVPLSKKFNINVPTENLFHMSMLIDSVKKNFNAKIGLIIDLTNTDRFYDAESEVKTFKIKYKKLNCKGHGETPTRESVDFFMTIVENFIRQNPTEIVGVHCTHGFNRTGFMICSYMVEKLDFSVDMAVLKFAQARPPGIYKQDYINELFKRYADPSCTIPVAPPLPTWETDDINQNNNHNDDGFDEDDNEALSNGNGSNDSFKRTKNTPGGGGGKRSRKEEFNLNSKFADPELEGIELVKDLDEIQRVRSETQAICGWNGAGFPGAQPVSMDQQNIRFIFEKKYQVSWKADGTRYLMYLNGPGKTFMLDRDNSVFIVKSLTFLHRKEPDRHLSSTLLDGEFVVDEDPQTKMKIPRFLIYDIIKYEKDDVGKMSFDIRMLCIEKEIINTRNEAIKSGKINRQIEPFSIRQKLFYQIGDTKKLLSPEFTKQLSHGIDGLIYQPVDEPYKAGRCDTILKWKPPSMNSVDFRLKIGVREEYGGHTEKVGFLYVLGYHQPFSTIKLTKTLMNLDNKIIECRWFEGRWDFMRERFDKSYPNHMNTAMAVCESIKNPITEQRLLDIVQDIEKRRMPPPQMAPPIAHNR